MHNAEKHIQTHICPKLAPKHGLDHAHAFVRDALCAMADAVRADKLGEERALHPLEKATPPNEITEAASTTPTRDENEQAGRAGLASAGKHTTGFLTTVKRVCVCGFKRVGWRMTFVSAALYRFVFRCREGLCHCKVI